MKKTIQSHFFILAFLLLAACNNPNDENLKQTDKIEKTITGTTESIEYGKDGYTAQIKTKTGDIYLALISIPNLGGMENYSSLNIGDKATLQGEVRTSDGQQFMKVTKIIDVEIDKAKLLISNHSFEGISPGDKIASHSNLLEKDVLQNGEAAFDIYRIKNQQYGAVAYFLPDPTNNSLVGNITIDSPEAKTTDGFHIGTTLADLLKKYPKLEIHGSEIEGRTYAVIDNLSFRLNLSNFSYEVPKNKVPTNTKVIEIIINR